MAFTTELVARLGPQAEALTGTLPVNTLISSNISTLASVTVPAGTWLCAMSVGRRSTSANELRLYINGVANRNLLQDTGLNGKVQFWRVLTDPGTVTFEKSHTSSNEGEYIIARIG